MNQQLYDSLPDRLKELIGADKYQEAFDAAQSISEEEQVAELYLENHFGNFWPIVEDSKDILIKLCRELGELDNDFITLEDNYLKKVGVDVGRQGMVALNNLYANEVIDDHNLNGTDEDGDINKSILYNKNIYNTSDPEFLITAYYWLSQPGNVKRMNLNALASDRKISPVVKDIAQLMVSEDKLEDVASQRALRNAIIYDNLTSEQALSNANTTMYDVRNVNDVRNILKVKDNRNNSNAQTDSNLASLVADISKLSDSEQEELFKLLGVTQEQ